MGLLCLYGQAGISTGPYDALEGDSADQDRKLLEVPKPQRVHVTVSDEQDHAVLEKDMTTSAEGTIAGDIELKANASLGYYAIRIGAADDGAGGSFRVEAYRKAEFQERVSEAKPHVLEGDTTQVTIDSRYFFGEPVASAVVKYKVFHAPHYCWEDEGDEGHWDRAY